MLISSFTACIYVVIKSGPVTDIKVYHGFKSYGFKTTRSFHYAVSTVYSICFLFQDGCFQHYFSFFDSRQTGKRGETFGNGRRVWDWIPRTAASRTIASLFGCTLNPYTTSAAPSLQ
ncbi:hypothetical protein XENOCAPTIV_021324 [Xenoophorus captivus]|uniref:Uncharacterized protein n=1 Tax=Xenoophorus captivus TaxID=1517983 RepID=A0ABV0Q3W0_9TELE